VTDHPIMTNQKELAGEKREDNSLGLYDSATGETLETIKTVDVSDKQNFGSKATISYGEARRGRLAQLRFESLYIHWFFDEPEGRQMIRDDSERFGFGKRLLQIIVEHAPPSIAALKDSSS
jgi:hypothetical protein